MMSRRRLYLNTLLLGILLTLCGVSHGDDKTVNLVTVQWPPYTDKDASNLGFISEVAVEAFKVSGYKTHIHFVPWIRGIKDTKAGHYDAIFPAYYSEERAVTFTISDSLASGELGFFTKASDNIAYTSMEDLKPYRIGVVRGYVNTKEFDEATYLTKSLSNSDEQNLRKLLKGRVDLAVADRLLGNHLVQTKIPEAKGKLKFIKPALKERQLYLLFSKANGNDQRLNNAFKEGLDSLKKTGTYQAIVKKYLH